VRRERRSIPGVRLKVVHRHRRGEAPERRVSDLVFIDGRPHAVLRWEQRDAARRPALTIPLDSNRLRPAKRVRALFRYEGVTE